jgi:hypothetical protein
MKCEVALQAANVRAAMQEQFKAGMREGMKCRATFGPEKSTEMAVKHSLLPEWNRAEDDNEHVGLVKAKYAELRLAFDAIDDPVVAAKALAVAVGCAATQTNNPVSVLETAQIIATGYAGLAENEAASAGS